MAQTFRRPNGGIVVNMSDEAGDIVGVVAARGKGE
jgi:hypothetical protein